MRTNTIISLTRLFTSFLTTVCCLGLVLVSTNSIAQITDPFVQCTNGCTANDVQIKRAYLVQPTSPFAELNSSFQCKDSADVKLALDLTAKTPRIGVYVFARVVNHTNHATIYSIVGECFSATLASTGVTKVVFNKAISWPCGTPIDLIDVFIGWGTGNTDFCAGSSDPRCPATPSKCYSLPPGQYITIQIPSASNTTMEQCETTAGGGTSSFDLTTKNSTVSNNVSGVTVNWWSTYSGGVLSDFIGTPTAYVSGSKNVYAKVKNNSDSTAYSVATVGLTVDPKPSVTSTTDSKCSSSGGGTTATFDLTSYESTIKGTQSGVILSWFTNSTLATTVSTPSSYSTASTTLYAKVTNSTTGCYSVATLGLTVNSRPTNPSVSVTQPTCASASGTVTVTSPTGSDYEYNNNGGAWQSSTSFTVAASGSYLISVRNKTTLCTSTGTASGTLIAQPAGPSTPAVCVIQPSLCGPAMGKVKFTDLGAGYQYSIDGTTFQDCPVFVNVAAGTVSHLRVRNSLGCQSPDANCNSICTDDPSTIVACPVSPTTHREVSNVVSESQIAVKAFPNPFGDQVTFIVNSPTSGSGSLEIYNSIGQKVKTVYQGHINTGNNTFELTVPKKQQATLIYMFRVGDKKVTGKLLQLNN